MPISQRVIAVIIGGGRGTRLRPLTRERAKPAVPLAGMYRLVDIPISNRLNSGLNQIYLLTQFNSASVHRHTREAYKFDSFGGGFVEILAAEQTETGEAWYQGTADAVRQNLVHLAIADDDLVLILSGDQLYRMDYQRVIAQHRQTQARVTVAATSYLRLHSQPKRRISARRSSLGYSPVAVYSPAPARSQGQSLQHRPGDHRARKYYYRGKRIEVRHRASFPHSGGQQAQQYRDARCPVLRDRRKTDPNPRPRPA